MMIVRRRLASAVSGWEDSLGGMASLFEVYVSDSEGRCCKWLKRREGAMVRLTFDPLVTLDMARATRISLLK